MSVLKGPPCRHCGVYHRTLTEDQCVDRKMSEKTLQARVIYRAKRDGWTVAHAGKGQVGPEGFFRTQMAPGWPDLTCAKAGHRLLFVECKRQQGEIEPEQDVWLQLLNQCGAYAVVVRPQDLRLGWVDILFREGAPIGAH